MRNLDQLFKDIEARPGPAWSDLPEAEADELGAVFDSKKDKESKGTYVGFKETNNEAVNAIVRNLGVTIHYNHPDDPSYDSNIDKLSMPMPESFKSPDHYTRTVLHELSHWTQNHGVLRPFRQPTMLDALIGDITHYALEELAAESSVSILIEELGVPMEEYNLEYLRSWMVNGAKTKEEQRALLSKAYPAGQKIAAFLLSHRGYHAVPSAI